jgi:hypothetical protein
MARDILWVPYQAQLNLIQSILIAIRRQFVGETR